MIVDSEILTLYAGADGLNLPSLRLFKSPNPLRKRCCAYQEEGKGRGDHTEAETKEKQTLKCDLLLSL